MANVEAEIAKRIAIFEANYASQNFDGIAELFTADAKFMPYGDKLGDPSAVAPYFKYVFDTGRDGVKLTTDEVLLAGDLAIERGNFVFLMKGKPENSGKYVVVWKNVGGTWKLHFDIFNGDTVA